MDAVMASPPAVVIDSLNSLLEAELSSVFRFITEEAFPYLSRAQAVVRKPLADARALSDRHAAELADLIDSLGGVALPRSRTPVDEQFVAYLSLQFLLPKLVNEKQLLLQRYVNVQTSLGHDYPQIARELQRMIDEQRQMLTAIRKAAAIASPGSGLSAG